MPEFTDPFTNNASEHKLTKQELIRAIRLDIAAEHEAVSLYMAHAESIDDPLAKEVLVDIANEEREHIGEFVKLLEILTGDEQDWTEHGRREVEEIAEEVGGSSGEGTTVGSLK